MSSAVVPPPDAPAADERLEELVCLLDTVEQTMAKAVLLAGDLSGSGVAEQVEGLSLEHFLGLRHRMPRSDIRMLLTAGQVLGHLPVTRRLYARDKLSWGQVRRITMAARRLTVDQRGELDDRVQATVDERGGVDAFDPDGLVDAVDMAVDEIRERDARKKKDPARDNYLAVQQRIDGGIKFHGEADAVTGAGILNALHAAAARPAGAGQEPVPGEPTVRGRQLLDGLATICADWLGGGSDKPARPLFVTHIDVSRPDIYGLLEHGVRGKTPRIPAAVLDLLARDADFQAVIFDGSRPLAVSDKIHTKTLPTDLEIAIRARDLGCRFPGSRDPLAFTDSHHIFHDPRRRSHHPDMVVKFSRRSHKTVHDHGWNVELDAPTGQVTVKRRRRVWKSLPRGTPLAEPPPRTDDPTPPGMPF